MKQTHFQFIKWSLVVIGMFCSNIGMKAAYVLFKDGKSAYNIIVSEQASKSEQTAARELQSYLQKIGGVTLPISNTLTLRGPKIFVGHNSQVARLTGKPAPASDDEGFTYQSVGKDIVIFGGSQRGTLYGVSSFLEDMFGVRWYTPAFTKVPEKSTWSFESFKISQRPSLGYRYSNYFATKDAAAWSAHNKENMKWTPSENEYGNLEAYWNGHTMGQFITGAEFFEAHPEYFALRDGKRVKDSQLCLSNPEVLKICRDRLIDEMKREPLYRIYSLSQNDNQLFCECDSCKAIEKRYGGHSGLILWFVNQVAEAVEPLFPDKYVGTFAYLYSRKPPVGIVPRSNVVIRLCSIECCFAHPLTSDCPQNKEFMSDMKAWSNIAPHLFIWDYIVDYAQYMAPWPNFAVLAPNIRAFRDHKAIGVFEEAQYQSNGGEFDEMKAWVISKLLWNPELNTEDLVKDFIEGYYGKAASKVLSYYHLCQSLVKPDTHFGLYIKENDPVYTDEFVSKGFELLDDAQMAAENDEIKQRVERLNLQLLYLASVRNYEQAVDDGTWNEFLRVAKKYNARPNETQTFEMFLKLIQNRK